MEFATGRRWTWRELDRDVDAVARGLIAAGIEKGDRVGIWAPNCAEWTITQYATAKIGAILVNVNPAYRTHEFSYAVNQSGHAAPGLGRPPSRPATTAAMVEETISTGSISGGLLERVVYLDTDDWDALVAEGEALDADVLNRAEARRSSRATRSTSSTRPAPPATPRARRCRHRNILNNGYFVTELIGFTEQDRLCIPVPFYHCFGMVMGNLGCTTHGATMVIPAPGFDPEATLRAIAEERCTALYGVPTMFIAMQHAPDVRRPRPVVACAPGSWPARSARSR